MSPMALDVTEQTFEQEVLKSETPVIVDFWAEWCGPCHVLTPKIEKLVQENANVALRTVDLKHWDTAVAKQATKEFRVAALPYVRVYGPDGKFVGEVLGNDIEKIRKLVGAGK